MSDHENRTVKWSNETKGKGFIQRVRGGDVFVHYSGNNGVGFRSLVEGQHVEFLVSEGIKGPQAQEVSVIDWS